MDARVKYDELTEFTTKVLEGMGYPRENAELTAWVLVEADARGISSHGVGRLDFYEKNIKGGFAVPTAKPTIVRETGVGALIDGNHAVGSVVAKFAMEKCIEKAEKVGAGFATVRNSNHFGMAGLWAEKAAARDQIGMSFTNTRICAIPTFGRQRILGTNPVCVAIPAAGKIPFMLDMATTTVAHGKIEVYERRDAEMPLGWVVDERGVGTTDTKAFQKLFWSKSPDGGHLFLGGEGEELGGHNGYGLGLLVDLLCAGLSMGRWSYRTFSGTGSGIAHFFGAIHLSNFGDPAEIKKHVEGILEEVRGSHRAEGQERIYIHGEKESEAHARSLREGVEVDDSCMALLRGYGKKFGIPFTP
ncbi:MAG: Ldh family oxidoreductase [Deltaproteobacteria bacterium]|nr:Ldh family oxidoreductase [Deltaproteobacteria bacterium]